ncbi:Heat shock protein 67B2 [Cyphomyrmex costatus]|uniref:Sulfurtransferase n=2 Tax=Cyphomyrmex costatus TaxID=456900 RepID=A0A151IBN0_9HYME|nr:Heat shock protein 67B2 [Cyphomyrmex costatus]
MAEEQFVVKYLDLLQELEKPDVLVIDVRESDEINKSGKIPGSINIRVDDVVKELVNLTEEDFEERYKIPKPAKNTKIIFSCLSGRRAEIAYKNMMERGYTQVYFYRGSFKEWMEKQKPERQAFIIKYEQLLEDQKNPDVLIVDVREFEEIDETGKLPESINIRTNEVVNEFELSEDKFEEKYGKPKPTKNTKIIFSCRAGSRSEYVQKQMQELGYKQVYNFEGGWEEWKQQLEKKRK